MPPDPLAVGAGAEAGPFSARLLFVRSQGPGRGQIDLFITVKLSGLGDPSPDTPAQTPDGQKPEDNKHYICQSPQKLIQGQKPLGDRSGLA